MLGQRSIPSRPLRPRTRVRGRRASRRARTGRNSALSVLLVASLFHLAGAPSASTATAHLPSSSADQQHSQLPSAPAITTVDAADARLDVAFTGSSDPVLTYEYSTDGGATWRQRTDGDATSSPLQITSTSADASPLANGTTYLVRLRAMSTVGPGRVSNLVTATPSAPQPPPGTGGSVRWIPFQGQQDITIDPNSSAISFAGGGERRALVDMAPTSRGTLTLPGTQFTRGNGWGVIVHGGFDGQGRFEGYTVQFDRGFGGSIVVRYWSGGTEFSAPLATSDARPVSNAVHDARIEVDGPRLRVVFDGQEELVVEDLPAAIAAAGATGPIRTEGVFGLRAWSATDLVVPSAQLEAH